MLAAPGVTIEQLKEYVEHQSTPTYLICCRELPNLIGYGVKSQLQVEQ
ncbi:MAG: hypothetical protein F6K08_14365 [Okeania sp. SIO1H6]|nr:hypothetical protein [Okeania sp. SIO1H6]